jgi:murein DD-endopeptidase MepM/ murein hydrolase activator NlpD
LLTVGEKFMPHIIVLLISLVFYTGTLHSNESTPSLYGEFTQGSIVRGKTETGSMLWLNDREIAVSKEGWFVIGFGRDAKSKQQLRWQYINGEKGTLALTVKTRQYNIQRIEGVPQSRVTPNPDRLARIKQETGQVKAARKQYFEALYFNERFELPIKDARITGVYGSQRVYNGVPKRPHYGIDYAAPTGTSVTAPAGGIVTLAHKDMYYSGGTLILDHGHRLSSSFLHLSKLLVAVGDTVQKGQKIAEVGSGGRSTGPHLDWRMNWKGERVDPLTILDVLPINP